MRIRRPVFHLVLVLPELSMSYVTLPECTLPIFWYCIVFMKIVEMIDYKKVLKTISIVHKIQRCKSSVNHRFKLFWKYHFYAYFL